MNNEEIDFTDGKKATTIYLPLTEETKKELITKLLSIPKEEKNFFISSVDFRNPTNDYYYKKTEEEEEWINEWFERKEEIEEKNNFSILTNTKKQGDEFRKVQPYFYDKSGIFWLWNLKKYYWEIVDEVDLLNMIEDSTGQDTITPSKKTKILNLLKQTGRRNVPKEIKKTWIQFKNKIIDIETEKIFYATPEYFVTNPIPHELTEKEDTPTMDKIFKEWVGEDKIKTLYEILAYSLLTDMPIHRIFCFIGGGMNGKSKFLELLRNFIGADNCCTTELDTLLNSRFEITRLHKKLVCEMGETDFNEMKRTSILKKLSGGDSIGFEYKNKNPFQEKNYAKILIATNNLPTTTDKTVGFYRRWMIIDFPNQFTEKKDILKEIPKEEYNNLTLKSIKLLKELLNKRKFNKEGSIEERTKRYEDHSNPLEKFWSENIKESHEQHIFKYEFKKQLETFCKNNKFRVINDLEIARFMKQKEISTKKIQAEWYSKDDNSKPWLRAWIGISFK